MGKIKTSGNKPDEHALITSLQAINLFFSLKISFLPVRLMKRFILGTCPPLYF
jgi:hypothetical protein